MDRWAGSEVRVGQGQVLRVLDAMGGKYQLFFSPFFNQ
jgi:hypothetical protein